MFVIRKNSDIGVPGGKPPQDSAHVIIERQYVSVALYGAMSAWAGVGMLQTVAFFVFNRKFRLQRYRIIYTAY